MKKIFLAILITLFIITTVSANTLNYNEEADFLNKLGIFKGSNLGYELERAPKRVEGAVMIVRIMGKENEVLDNTYTHPFIDVPEWADNYIGYLYENKLTTGMSENEFGSNYYLNGNQYSTFMLRCLGYNDSEGDFQWDKALEKTVEIELLEGEFIKNIISSKTFTRGDMVHITYNTMLFE
jgi:hypothetical protein